MDCRGSRPRSTVSTRSWRFRMVQSPRFAPGTCRNSQFSYSCFSMTPMKTWSARASIWSFVISGDILKTRPGPQAVRSSAVDRRRRRTLFRHPVVFRSSRASRRVSTRHARVRAPRAIRGGGLVGGIAGGRWRRGGRWRSRRGRRGRLRLGPTRNNMAC